MFSLSFRKRSSSITETVISELNSQFRPRIPFVNFESRISLMTSNSSAQAFYWMGFRTFRIILCIVVFKGLLIFSKLGFKLGFNDVSYMVSNSRFLKRQFILEENKLWANQKLNKWKRPSCEQVPSSMSSTQYDIKSVGDPVIEWPSPGHSGIFSREPNRSMSFNCMHRMYDKGSLVRKGDEELILKVWK